MTEIAEPSQTQARVDGSVVNAGRLTSWLSFFGVVAASFAGIGLIQSTFFPVSVFSGRYPGINLTVLVSIGLGSALVLMTAFLSIGSLIRRPGPDYVLASRTISPRFAFASSLTLVVGGGLFMGGMVSTITRQFAPDFLRSLASIFGIYDLQAISTAIGTQQTAAIFGSVILFVVFAISILAPWAIRAILQTGFILGVVGWVVTLYQFGSIYPNGFTAQFDGIFGTGTSEGHINLAYQFGMTSASSPAATVIILGLLAGLGIFFGSALPTLMASETAQPQKKLIPGGLLAVLVGGGLLIATVALLERAVPWQFLAAESYLLARNIEITGGFVMPWLPFYAAVIQPVPILVIVSGAIWLYMLVLFVQIFMMTLSRVIKAWAEDGIVPEWAGSVHAKQHSPLIAVFLVAAIMQVGLVDGIQGGDLSRWLSLPIVVALSQLVPMAGLMLFPFRKPEWFREERGFLALRIFKLPLISILGFICMIFMVWVLAGGVLHKEHWLPITAGTYLLPGLVFVGGLAWYSLRWRLLKRHGVDLKPVFASLPGVDDLTHGEDGVGLG